MQTINLIELSISINGYNNCVKTLNTEWEYKHLEIIEIMCKNLPHGSGIDGKCEIDIDNSTDKRILFFFEFHHLDNNGYYCGWSEHNVIITPNFGGFDIKITGIDKNNVKEYLYYLWRDLFTVEPIDIIYK